LQIVTTGDVRVCCWSNGSLGNLKVSTIDEIWTGSLLTDLREHVKNNKVHYLCKNSACPYVQGLVRTDI
jgi:MoaA/NifB/PqqE/SkfB family radical SAM enzyme